MFPAGFPTAPPYSPGRLEPRRSVSARISRRGHGNDDAGPEFSQSNGHLSATDGGTAAANRESSVFVAAHDAGGSRRGRRAVQPRAGRRRAPARVDDAGSEVRATSDRAPKHPCRPFRPGPVRRASAGPSGSPRPRPERVPGPCITGTAGSARDGVVTVRCGAVTVAWHAGTGPATVEQPVCRDPRSGMARQSKHHALDHMVVVVFENRRWTTYSAGCTGPRTARRSRE